MSTGQHPGDPFGTILLIGLGDLGGVMLEFLAREPAVQAIVVASRDPDRGQARCNLAHLSALAQGFQPDIKFIPLNLDDIEAVAARVHQINPQVVLCTASRLTWWLPGLLPADLAHRLAPAGFGAWLPIHLDLPMKLMAALRAADFRGHTLMAPYPDVVNCVLSRIGLAPACGVGNVAEMTPKVRYLAATRLGLPVGEVRVTMVAHHALVRAVYETPSGEVPPYFLRIEHSGQDLTAEAQGRELIFSPFPIPTDRRWHFLTAGATLPLVRAFLAEEGRYLHAPGPNGLPGGYPVLVSRRGVSLALPADLPQREAVAINEASHRFDGIAAIEMDGTVRFTGQTAEVMRQELGYDASRLSASEVTERARDLIARLRAYAGPSQSWNEKGPV